MPCVTQLWIWGGSSLIHCSFFHFNKTIFILSINVPAQFVLLLTASLKISPCKLHLLSRRTLRIPLKKCKLIMHASLHPLTLHLAICHGITSFQPIKSIRRIWFSCCYRGIPALLAHNVRGSNALASSIRRKPTDTSITGSVYPYTHQSPVCWCSLIHLPFPLPCTLYAPLLPPPTLPPVGAGGRASPLISSWNKQPGKHHETFKGGCAASFPLICTGKSGEARKKQNKNSCRCSPLQRYFMSVASILYAWGGLRRVALSLLTHLMGCLKEEHSTSVLILNVPIKVLLSLWEIWMREKKLMWNLLL